MNPLQPSRPGTPASRTAEPDSQGRAPAAGETGAAPPPPDGLEAQATRTAVLRLGSQGPEVVQLQQALRAAGAGSLEASGVFDEATRQALMDVQRSRGLPDDGVAGPRTRRALGLPETAASSPGAEPAGGRREIPSAPAEIDARHAGLPWRTLSEWVHQKLEVPGASEELTGAQVKDAFEIAGRIYGVPSELLEHTAEVEASNDQSADGGPAHGLMQIEKSAHPRAYQGERHAGNDTISNVIYGALLRSQAASALDSAFRKEGLEVPQGAARAALVDYGYNRGPGILAGIARRAAEQGIDPQNLQEYWAGKGGTVTFQRGDRGAYSLEINPGAGVDRTGEGSVLQEALQQDVPHMLLSSPRDRSRNGEKDHYDVWIQRTGSLLDALGNT